MERALSVFHGALVYGSLGDSSLPLPLQSLSAFDAHVGDCACQTRAQMFWELVVLYRTEENKAILKSAIARVKKIRVNAALLLEEIELHHGKSRNPNLSALVSHMAIWERIGFHSFLNLAAKTTQETIPVSNDSTESPVSKIAQKRSAHAHRDLAVDVTWNPNDLVSVARFLTICNLLSEFRIATIEAGPPTRVKVRVDLKLLYERNARELEGLQLTAKRPINYRVKAPERMTRQIETMQIYVSRVTTNWMKQTAIQERDLWSRFPEELIATSHRRITCVALYVSLLLVRNAWMKLDIPIFAVIQHFCSHGGYRNIYCRIVKNPMAEISGDQHSVIGEDHWFKVEIVSLDQVDSSPWGRIPHIIMICMSCQGTIEDFKRRLLEDQQGLLPLQHRCSQADDCAIAITRTNIARLLAHFFAQHEQFPFLLPGHEDRFSRVADALHSCLGREASATFAEARSGAEEFGTGRSTRLATIEHIFTEYPSILARDVKEYGERPRVWGCKLE
ncbi:hypothetical protein GYMLUDRAFT_74990 [Collybiopsis luxurians FD-317 M1]|uniref:Uncharacterized protein n=1 Tax=Collybiopsis luxurians FD-317 M1 TaxID=944289 RepID=A0A0D0CIR0_9AGAR|nr:hypothetical protein GYMLUDRAFT_74990 [Collybiopsis luxurians FD-317 M1]